MLQLTDDEVVAVAVSRQGFWPSVLPTIDANDVEHLAAASLRGTRALLVRGLLEDSGELSDELRAIAIHIPSCARAVLVYLGDREFGGVDYGAISNHYPIEREWITEAVSSLGIHAFATMATDEIRDYLTALLQGCYEQGPDKHVVTESGGPAWLCMLSVGPQGGVLLASRRGECKAGPASLTAGRVTSVEKMTEVDAGKAVDLLLSNLTPF